VADLFSSIPGRWQKWNSGDRLPAGFWRRFLAAVIDLLLILLISVTAAAYFGLGEGWRMLQMIVRRQEVVSDDGTVITSLFPMPAVTFILVVFILVPWIYYALLESSRNQATLGKMALRIQVADLHGNQITFARATLRHFSKFLSLFLLCTGFICIHYTKHKQGLHDVIAACLVWYKKEIPD
jgi:uncharacterized RDD family membrane protein YckC